MTNRDRLLNMSLYDLIMSLHKEICVIKDGQCISCKLSIITGYVNHERCNADCSECIQRYLNEEVKQNDNT